MIALIIPARYGSSRFAGKPLAVLAGTSLLERVYRIAKAVRGVDQVFVTTDDDRVAAHAESVGAPVIFTRAPCETGSDRVAQAAAQLPVPPQALINLQGDAVLTPPWVIEALVTPLLDAQQTSLMVTPAVRLNESQYQAFRQHKVQSPTSGTTVTVDRRLRALYFSKAIIPFVRSREHKTPPVYRHIGVYGYTWPALKAFAALPVSELERTEGLEQLRALENEIPIQVVPVDYRGRTHASVDTPEDLRVAEEIVAREGELLSEREP